MYSNLPVFLFQIGHKEILLHTLPVRSLRALFQKAFCSEATRKTHYPVRPKRIWTFGPPWALPLSLLALDHTTSSYHISTQLPLLQSWLYLKISMKISKDRIWGPSWIADMGKLAERWTRTQGHTRRVADLQVSRGEKLQALPCVPLHLATYLNLLQCPLQ